MHDFAGYMVDEKLLAAAPKHAIVMHCLPAYRGMEISDGVMEGKQSVIFHAGGEPAAFPEGFAGGVDGRGLIRPIAWSE